MIVLLTPGGPGTNFAAAFAEAREIVCPTGIHPGRPVPMGGSPRAGTISITIDESSLSRQQQADLMCWKLRWSGAHA